VRFGAFLGIGSKKNAKMQNEFGNKIAISRKKLFDTKFWFNAFRSIFELPSLGNTQKRDKTKKSRKA
jgi:hypothetical protein